MRLLRLSCRLVAFGIIAYASHDVAAAGRADRAPMPDDVVTKLVHAPLKRHAHAPAERLARYVEDALALLERLQAEQRTQPGPDSQPAARTTNDMLVGSTAHEVALIRAGVRDHAADIRAMLARAGHDHTRGWDDAIARIEARFDELQRLLDAVLVSTTKGARMRSLAAAVNHLRALRDARQAREAASAPRPSAPMPHALAPFRPLDGDEAPAPAYVTSAPREQLYASAGQPLLLAAAPVPGQEGVCSYTPEDLGQTARTETTITPEIQGLAESLGLSAVRIHQYVSNEIGFEPYYGSLKGAMGTLYSKAGNATDQASLLIALLRAANIPARYVKGTVRFVNDPRLLRWVGARDYAGAAQILAQGAIRANYSPTDQRIEFTHVWVEACVPYKNYRGTGSDTSGHRWIPLDPSFKDRAYQTGIAGIATNVAFDYTGYLARRTDALPEERYAD